MKSSRTGKSISKTKAEVANISANGLWLLIEKQEYFLPYNKFPWFKNAKVAEILNLKYMHGCHLHWPDLDVDLELDSLKFLEKYPLVYKL